MSEIVGIIPARGGSKGIPRKNIKQLAGKPMIAWTIEAAKRAKNLSRVLVSTEDAEIAKVAREFGAEVPFMRPSDLAEDSSPTIHAVEHAVSKLKEGLDIHSDYIMLLQPTSPLRVSQDVDSAIDIALRHDADAVVSVFEANPHPYLTKSISEDGKLMDFIKCDKEHTRRQDLPPAYALNGSIYLNRIESLLRYHAFLPEGAYAYVMPAERSLDVDTTWDFHLADLVLRDLYGLH